MILCRLGFGGGGGGCGDVVDGDCSCVVYGDCMCVVGRGESGESA